MVRSVLLVKEIQLIHTVSTLTVQVNTLHTVTSDLVIYIRGDDADFKLLYSPVLGGWYVMYNGDTIAYYATDANSPENEYTVITGGGTVHANLCVSLTPTPTPTQTAGDYIHRRVCIDGSSNSNDPYGTYEYTTANYSPSAYVVYTRSDDPTFQVIYSASLGGWYVTMNSAPIAYRLTTSETPTGAFTIMSGSGTISGDLCE
jgi:hypothetical protein